MGRFTIKKMVSLYEQISWKAKAIEHCQKFLGLWKYADPSIPEIEYAKKRLAGWGKFH